MVKGIAALSLLLLSTTALAQDRDKAKDAKKWDVAAPPMKTRQVAINTTEGTWMNVDVSPDGRTIAFDLLGDIYTLPIAGGRATRIASGMPYEVQPRFSPDGTQIAFTSDRGGGDNIWIMNVDGSGKRQMTKETFTLLNNPTWSPDGKYIAARKHFTTGRSLGTGEIWMYHVGGGGGVALVERPNPQHQKELGEPMFTPSGDGIYFSRNTTSGPIFEYAQNSNQQLFAIERYDLKTGERTTVAGGPGGAVRPQPSPDGRYLAYVHRERAKSKLYVKDLRSGEERKIYDALDQDVQETWAVTGVYPNMDWTPDSKSIVFWAGGKIRRVNLDGSGAAEIPFQVADSRDVIDPPRPVVNAYADSFTTRMPRFATLSPDGRDVLFESLGRLYVKPAQGGGAPRALTASDGDFQLFPSWSRDGSRIVFVSWNDQRLGEIRTVAADGSGMKTVTNIPGHYRRPRFSPDGQTIVFERGGGGYLTSDAWSENPGIFRVAAGGGEAVRLVNDGGNPHFGAGSDRIFFEKRGDQKLKLVSVDWNGKDERTHAQGEMVIGYEVAPTGDHLAFRENYSAFVMPFFQGAKTLEVGAKATALPITKASGDGGQYLHWTADGRNLVWSLGPTFYQAPVSAIVRTAPGGSYAPPKTGVSLAMPVRADKPEGVVALTGAKVVTMANEAGGIIEDGVVIVEDNRIKAVGRRGEIAIPAGAKTVDLAGKTIVPGFIDAHAHGAQGEDDVIPQQNWDAHGHLAFGVTTVHDPSSSSSEIFPAAEMQRAGIVVAPRTFSTGEIVYGAKAPGVYAVIDGMDDALAHVRRLKIQGAHSIKNYNQPRRDQRQQVVAAALKENIAVVAEGGSLFSQDITLIGDGNTTLEHNIPQAMLYKDVLDYFSATKVGYTPTLGVTYGGPGGEPYWLQESEVWKHPLLTRYVPAHILNPEMVRVVKAPAEDYADQVSARTADMLSDRGVPVSIGGHGQQQGLASHWEMWSFVRGGMTPIEALRAATSTPARALGFADIGSLEPGKLADLVILDADPTENIRNTEKIAKVMLNGRLYDAATLNEEVTGTRQRQPYYWEK
ncbi:amidohydrolase family protein [Sphingosinicella sp. LY1275]|uniref:amidohydrolase family protein n=1 Tax=Sphingosinicella sp. LY1275 TaxID=3095379 RepID=UPI002ADEB8E8|nr:amidohydrolase family protein [Sphingosinicella sp. LY1275]MEA1014006.1 amidohydrolase family protein [Sphingosinicella sp. LY1275]